MVYIWYSLGVGGGGGNQSNNNRVCKMSETTSIAEKVENMVVDWLEIKVFHFFSAYGYGALANLICCACSLAGAFIIPFAKRHKTAYDVVLSVFMGLAVGALASDAILHLVPEVSTFYKYIQHVTWVVY